MLSDKRSQLTKSVVRIGGSLYARNKNKNDKHYICWKHQPFEYPHVCLAKLIVWSMDLYMDSYIRSTKIIGVTYGLIYAFGESHQRGYGFIYAFGNVFFIFSMQVKISRIYTYIYIYTNIPIAAIASSIHRKRSASKHSVLKELILPTSRPIKSGWYKKLHCCS